MSVAEKGEMLALVSGSAAACASSAGTAKVHLLSLAKETDGGILEDKKGGSLMRRNKLEPE